jgi:alpha-beta hydrolase superfamily lysophospholipase
MDIQLILSVNHLRARNLARMAALAVILVCFLGSCRSINITEQSIFAPVVLANTSNASKFEEIAIPNNGGPLLNAIHFPNPTAAYYLLYLHGNSGSIWDREEFAQIEAFRKFGFEVFAVDYQGYGKSGGKPSVANLYQDSEATYAYVKSLSGSRPIVVYGFSLGSAAAIRLAKSKAPRAVILESTIDDPAVTARFFKKSIRLPKRWLVNINADGIPLTIRQDAAQIRVPVLMLHGQDDETAPFPLAKELFQVLGTPQKQLVEFPKAKHNTLFETDSVMYRKSITEFVKK